MLVALIEDDDDIRFLTRFNLAGHDVVEASSAEQAFHLPWDLIDAAFIDHQLKSNTTGAELLRWVNEHHPNVEAWMLTAQDPALLPEDVRDRVIVKPVGTEELRARLVGVADGP